MKDAVLIAAMNAGAQLVGALINKGRAADYERLQKNVVSRAVEKAALEERDVTPEDVKRAALEILRENLGEARTVLEEINALQERREKLKQG